MGVLELAVDGQTRNVGCGTQTDPGRLFLAVDGQWLREACDVAAPTLVATAPGTQPGDVTGWAWPTNAEDSPYPGEGSQTSPATSTPTYRVKNNTGSSATVYATLITQNAGGAVVQTITSIATVIPPTGGFNYGHAYSGLGGGETARQWMLTENADGTGLLYAFWSYILPAGGHPLKLNVGTPEAPDWVTVACMVPLPAS